MLLRHSRPLTSCSDSSLISEFRCAMSVASLSFSLSLRRSSSSFTCTKQTEITKKSITASPSPLLATLTRFLFLPVRFPRLLFLPVRFRRAGKLLRLSVAVSRCPPCPSTLPPCYGPKQTQQSFGGRSDRISLATKSHFRGAYPLSRSLNIAIEGQPSYQGLHDSSDEE